MTIANWILLSSLAVILILLIISHILKKTVLQKICECLIIPLFGALNVLLLRDYLPDSRHLIKITIIALSLSTISTIFLSLEKIKLLRISGRILILANVFCWITLYRTVFFIHKVPLWLTILMSCIYIAGTIAAIILSGKQEIKFYVLFACSFALSSCLHFCSLIFLCYETSWNSILLFAGATIFAALTAFHFINQAKLNFKHAGVIRYSLMLASQVLIASSNILMIK